MDRSSKNAGARLWCVRRETSIYPSTLARNRMDVPVRVKVPALRFRHRMRVVGRTFAGAQAPLGQRNEQSANLSGLAADIGEFAQACHGCPEPRLELPGQR